jgi:hypothetical protein
MIILKNHKLIFILFIVIIFIFKIINWNSCLDFKMTYWTSMGAGCAPAPCAVGAEVVSCTCATCNAFQVASVAFGEAISRYVKACAKNSAPVCKKATEDAFKAWETALNKRNQTCPRVLATEAGTE